MPHSRAWSNAAGCMCFLCLINLCSTEAEAYWGHEHDVGKGCSMAHHQYLCFGIRLQLLPESQHFHVHQPVQQTKACDACHNFCFFTTAVALKKQPDSQTGDYMYTDSLVDNADNNSQRSTAQHIAAQLSTAHKSRSAQASYVSPQLPDLPV